MDDNSSLAKARTAGALDEPKTAHTPGPWTWYWRVEDEEANCGVFWEQRSGMAYAVARCPRYQTKEKWEADARLISAAPDLLEALKAVMNDLMLLGSVTDATSMRAFEAIGKATTK